MKRELKKELTAEARRMDLIQGMLKSIHKHGYSNTTVQTICEESGLSRGLISHYFKGKEDLLIEAFRYLTQQSDEDAKAAFHAAGDDPFKRLLAVAEEPFHATREYGEVWLHFWSVALNNGEARKLRNGLWKRFRASIERRMTEAAEAKKIQINVKHNAMIFTQLIDGLWVGSLFDEEMTQETCQIVIRDWLCDLFHEDASAYPLKEAAKEKADVSRESA
ncbi:MAG: TetR family transcriptional regulator [Sphingobium sp.]